MNDKTYADGIEDAAKGERMILALELASERHDRDQSAHYDYGTSAWDGSVQEYLADALAFVDRCAAALTPDKTNTSEATAIGAGVREAVTAVLDCFSTSRDPNVCVAPRGMLIDGLLDVLAASPKPDTNTSVDPDVEGVREALRNLLLFADPSGDGLYDGASDIVGVKADGKIVLKGSFITTCIRAERALATIDHPIARSGMGSGRWRNCCARFWMRKRCPHIGGGISPR